jgi:hypothetical protein
MPVRRSGHRDQPSDEAGRHGVDDAVGQLVCEGLEGPLPCRVGLERPLHQRTGASAGSLPLRDCFVLPGGRTVRVDAVLAGQAVEVAVHLLDGFFGQVLEAGPEVDRQGRQVGSGSDVAGGQHFGDGDAEGSAEPGQLVGVRSVDESALEAGDAGRSDIDALLKAMREGEAIISGKDPF